MSFWLIWYICSTALHGTFGNSNIFTNHPPLVSSLYPLSKYLSYDKFSSDHVAFLSAISHDVEPTTYSQAVQHAHWRNAMDIEIKALEQSNTWTIQDLPPGKKPIGCK